MKANKCKWAITIVITDLTGKYTATTLGNEIKSQWLPVTYDITLNELKVGLVQSNTRDN